MSTEVATQDNGNFAANEYSSVAPTTAKEAARLYSAISSASPLKDAVNVPLKVVDVIVRPGTVTRDNGIVEDALVTTLVTEDGKAFASNSDTVATDIHNLIRIMGEPRKGFWGKGLVIVPKLQSSNNNRSFITLTLGE